MFISVLPHKVHVHLIKKFRSQVAPPLTLHLPLSCPQIVTARIMTSWVHCLVGGLSKKKQTLTTDGLNKKIKNGPLCQVFRSHSVNKTFDHLNTMLVQLLFIFPLQTLTLGQKAQSSSRDLMIMSNISSKIVHES